MVVTFYCDQHSEDNKRERVADVVCCFLLLCPSASEGLQGRRIPKNMLRGYPLARALASCFDDDEMIMRRRQMCMRHAELPS